MGLALTAVARHRRKATCALAQRLVDFSTQLRSHSYVQTACGGYYGERHGQARNSRDAHAQGHGSRST
jgi:hypothetical protein